MKNIIIINGEKYDCGPVPYVLTKCGFKDAQHVQRVASRYGRFQIMNLKDVEAWLKKEVR